MPPYQPPHDHTGPPNPPPTAPAESDDGNEDIATAAAVAAALRAASANSVANPKSSLPPPSTHLKTIPLSPGSRPPRTSSLLPPRVLHKLPSEGDEFSESADANHFWHRHPSAAIDEGPRELYTFPDHGSHSGAHRPGHHTGHQRAAPNLYNLFDNSDSQSPSVASQHSTSHPQTRGTEAGRHTYLADKQFQPVASTVSFTSSSPIELLPLLDSDVGGPFSPAVDRPHTEPLPTEKPSCQMPQESSHAGPMGRGHGRRRSSRGSNDVDKGKSTSKPPSQKAMLSRALQKANTAVQLDNAQNLEGARIAYSEACELLQQVLRRTSGDEDKRKLEAIRQTYASRIEELDQLGPMQDQDAASKALPARPGSDEYSPELAQNKYSANGITSAATVLEANMRAESSNTNRTHGRRPTSPTSYSQQHSNDQAPPNIRATEWHRTALNGQQGMLQSSFSKNSTRSNQPATGSQEKCLDVPQPMNRAASPLRNAPEQHVNNEQNQSQSGQTGSKGKTGHARDDSQNSWLDGIGESGGSTASSIHSRTSSQGLRRKHLRAVSANTETEFDTALDAAIEAAYDDGYEPMMTTEVGGDTGEEAVARVLRRVEIARERVRQTEQETLSLSNGTDIVELLSPRKYRPSNTEHGFYDEDSSDDEERMLEEITRDYDIADFTMSEAVPAIVTRTEEGRPSGETQSEFRSQVEPVRVLTEKKSISNIIKGLGPSLPPPNTSLPELPPPRGTSPMQSVRNRRLSGQNPKQLKIDTTKPNSSPLVIHSHSDQPRVAREQETERPSTATGRIRTASHARSTPSIDVTSSEPSKVVSLGGHRTLADFDEGASTKPASPTASNNKLRKNFSSSSLRSMKSRNMSLSNFEDPSDMSPGTPSSNQFGGSRTPAVPTVPTPMSSEFRDNLDSSSTGARLFDDHFHQPTSPGSADNAPPDAPVPLEPCPHDFMLRPFWLMRCIFQTLVHPRGGYVSSKLFVPRDVWKVKGVKLKNVDDKIANCDLLTAALLKLARVDTCDADAVLEEMQSLEGILEQVQASLTRKLGNDVGVQGSAQLEARIAAIPIERYRNFCIVAHIDHGKSTLSDRLLEHTGTISASDANKQILDKLDVERERGITVKAQTCTMLYNYKGEDYLLHLVDTPGHVDFRAEVTRSYASCGGAILLVDASQGIQAQTVSNFHLAFAQGLALLPVVNKIDMPSADVPSVLKHIEDSFELDPDEAVPVSAKTGQGIDKVLPAVIEKIPHPVGDLNRPLKMLLVDSWYDNFRGVVLLVRIFDGTIRAGDNVVSLGTGMKYTVGQVGVQFPDATPQKALSAGQVGYVYFNPGMKQIKDAKLGDTFTVIGSEGFVEPCPGFEEPKPMVFVAAFPTDQGDYSRLADSINQLVLNDRSVTLQKDHSEALGAGWRLGFLGSLHCSVFQDRLKQEHGRSIIITEPTVPTKIIWGNGREEVVQNPALFPDTSHPHVKNSQLLEPFVKATITVPEEHLGRVIELCEANRGQQKSIEFFNKDQVILVYDIPASQLVEDLFGKLKGSSKGYATLDYEDAGWRESKLSKVQLLVNKQPVDAICKIVHASQVERVGRRWVTKFKEHVDRQMFEVVIQAIAGNKIIARETIKPFRKDVLAKLHASDISRRRKLLEKQKDGRKRLRAAYYHVTKNPEFHQTAYALLTAIVVLHGMWVMETRLRPQLKARHGDEGGKILATSWVMVATGLSVFLGGFFVWNLDNIYCSQIRGWRREIGLPWAVLLEGHGWWHLLTGLAYYYIVWGIWLRRCLAAQDTEYELHWPAMLTSIPEVRRVRSNGWDKKHM
ncbi:hypothetical protein V2A60_001184 [Cordyceps javanica]